MISTFSLLHIFSGLDLDINESKSRRFRLYSLLVDGGTRVFRNIFDKENPPEQLKKKLSNVGNRLQELKRGKIINDSEFELLFPSQGDPKSTTFDISLLAVLLRNISGFNPNDASWNVKNPASTDKSVIADIVRIRELRNKVMFHFLS